MIVQVRFAPKATVGWDGVGRWTISRYDGWTVLHSLVAAA
jgi:hypothetical protein